MNELEFKKFISYKKCTFLEFKKAEMFYKETLEYSLKKDFLFTCFNIISSIIKRMKANKIYNFTAFQNIYSSHGLTLEDFKKYYYLYISQFNNSDKNKDFYALIFEASKECMWDESKLRNIAKDFLITNSKLKSIIEDYFINELHFGDFKDYKKLYKYYIHFINNDIISSHNLEYAYSFYLKYANNNEKENFQKLALKIIKDALKHLENMEEYAQTINLKSLDIYFLAKNFDEDFEQTIANSFKIYFDYCVQSLWNIEEITKVASELNIRYRDFYDMAKIYCCKILKKNIEELRHMQLYKEKNNDLSNMGILSKIYHSSNPLEYFYLIEKSDITYGDIYYFCYIFHSGLPDNKKQEMEINIKEKFLKYRQQINYSKPDNTEILLDALDSFYTLEEYAQVFGYNYKSIKNQFSVCKDPDILKRYKEKLQSEKNIKNTYQNNLVFSILWFIKHGFRSGDNIYPFTLIDAYILFPNINFLTLKTGALSLADAKILRNFFNPLKNACKLSKDTIINMKFKQMNTEIFTQDELINIVEFMEYYNIPLNDVLLNDMLTRYKNNNLALYEFNTYMVK